VRHLTTPRDLPRPKFQSTHSLRSATGVPAQVRVIGAVSIHALLAECDRRPSPGPGDWRSFNPRTPYGVRRREILHRFFYHGFNPRTPYGVRPVQSLRSRGRRCFNPRTPCGVRLGTDLDVVRVMNVSIHALLAECD